MFSKVTITKGKNLLCYIPLELQETHYRPCDAQYPGSINLSNAIAVKVGIAV